MTCKLVATEASVYLIHGLAFPHLGSKLHPAVQKKDCKVSLGLGRRGINVLTGEYIVFCGTMVARIDVRLRPPFGFSILYPDYNLT